MRRNYLIHSEDVRVGLEASSGLSSTEKEIKAFLRYGQTLLQ
jgi:hypothetical protein